MSRVEVLPSASASVCVSEIETAAARLGAWCRARDFAGHDPYDGLNSAFVRRTPLKHSRFARLAWTQAFKRSPVNLRTLLRVPAQRNPKGTALFALAALARFRRTGSDEAEREARLLLADLAAVSLRDAALVGDDAAAWSYNFDWQGRAFFAPRGTPTIVPTAFAARALVEASRVFHDKQYLQLARRACVFIINCLPRSVETEDEICFAYSPFDRTRVFNASLLAAETLAQVALATHDRAACNLAMRAAAYVVHRQQPDGRWAYGAESYQAWADNFHTAFIISSLLRLRPAAAFFGSDAENELDLAIRRGDQFWRANFFDADGAPKYYPDRRFPIDAHSAGASLATFADINDENTCGVLASNANATGALPDARTLAFKVAAWTIRNMQDKREGYFYYQQRSRSTIRTPFMRWSQAWMLYGMERILEKWRVDKG